MKNYLDLSHQRIFIIVVLSSATWIVTTVTYNHERFVNSGKIKNGGS